MSDFSNTNGAQDENRFMDFIKNVGKKLSNLTTLEIKTIVGDFEVNTKSEIQPKKDGDFKVISTNIDLIGGDIVTHISQELVYEQYAWLRDFHARKEERGHQMVGDNIHAIMSLIDLYRSSKNVDTE